MFTFADLMNKAQGGQALDNIAAAYGLKRSDLDALTGTLLPVFQLGLQRTLRDMASPAPLGDLLDPDTFGAAFEDAHAAMSPAATEAGRMALERMFGSRDAARVVADQAAAITGVGSDVVSKVMPTLAATLLGGIGKAIEDTPMRDILKTWSGGVDPATAPLAAMAAPYRDAMNAFMKGYAKGKPKPKPEIGAEWAEGMEAFGKMFQAGVELNEQNRRSFEQILDGFRKPD
ncbi:MAG TPA: DUF937 domain-containing protein [Methylomirabilota bacterium]|nr:DUF937 domain-containing protein [Methylomirabilota bacterium]